MLSTFLWDEKKDFGKYVQRKVTKSNIQGNERNIFNVEDQQGRGRKCSFSAVILMAWCDTNRFYPCTA